ncbi:hypothetical protein E2C01_095051 [Portunus trituberculatus]|uniref:Uncharacterized protein n=1 Tax=Portunus trituberculatus TaxID=210409 RepID=A0A5B7K4S1_PORTR|nr:hypothetical protein [Portunus trituberculatus]
MVLDVAVAGSVGVNGTMTQVVAQARKVPTHEAILKARLEKRDSKVNAVYWSLQTWSRLAGLEARLEISLGEARFPSDFITICISLAGRGEIRANERSGRVFLHVESERGAAGRGSAG